MLNTPDVDNTADKLSLSLASSTNRISKAVVCNRLPAIVHIFICLPANTLFVPKKPLFLIGAGKGNTLSANRGLNDIRAPFDEMEYLIPLHLVLGKSLISPILG